MSVQTIELIAGLALLFVAVVGGGFTAKEVQIPKLPGWGRLALAVLGAGLIGVFIWGLLYPDDTTTPRTCRHPAVVPQVADGRQVNDARYQLTVAGLFNVVTEPAYVPSAPHGAVVTQKPAAGAVLCPRDLVTLGVVQ